MARFPERSAAAARSGRAAPSCGSNALDGPMPRIAAPTNQVVTQREKTFLPHVLAVPLGTTVQFRNDDRIYHNVFSIAKPNDFDAGIRATGATYTRTFTQSRRGRDPVQHSLNHERLRVRRRFAVSTRRRRRRGRSASAASRPGATSWPRGTRRRPTSRARRSWSAATGRAIWRSRSAATSAPDPSSRTNTDTNASPSSGTRMTATRPDPSPQPSPRFAGRGCRMPRIEGVGRE